MPILTATPAQQSLAAAWHGGQFSMLYAVASTGALSRGTVPPFAGATDREWTEHLVWSLMLELADVAGSPYADPDDAATAHEWYTDVKHLLHTIQTDNDDRPRVIIRRYFTCHECERRFDMLDPDDAAEWTFGHDCEA